jgi:molybdate transport system substrate-binding protein
MAHPVLGIILRLAALLVAVAAGPALAKPGADLTVFAAASLREALDEQVRRYGARTGRKIVASYAGSAALARQVERGAPADIFISADLKWMDYLALRKALRADTRRNLLTNRLVLVAPASSSVSLEIRPGLDLSAALGDGRLAVADPETVPAGRYARAALEALAAWNAVSSRLVRAENVRIALAYVARGETPLGIVYRTDAIAEPKVRVVAEFPENTHPSIVYPAAVLVNAKSSIAGAFLDYLDSPAAREVWERHGFGKAG